MPKIYFLKWLPASGKSTWAKEQVAKNPHGTVRVNKDDLRAMCHNWVWGKDNEKLIIDIRDSIIWEALDKNRNVIVDDTNFNPDHIENIRKIAKDKLAEVIVKFFDVPVEECIERDSHRWEKSVGSDVIMKMYNDYLKPSEEPLEQDFDLPHAIIVDIDGTVAKMNWRWPHDYNRVSEDLPHHDIIDLVHMFSQKGYKIIFLSGRKPSCFDTTKEWIMSNIQGDSNLLFELYMRESEDDNRKDYIFKEEAYDKYIKGKYYVKYCIDDRDQVVKLWRSLWLRCLQVADGNF